MTKSQQAADLVVDEIRAAGGRAVASYDSVENGEKIIETAIKEFGKVDILLNNAGILRDVSFKNMSDEDWDLVIKVHVKGSYKVSHAFQIKSDAQLIFVIPSVPELRGHIFGSRGMAESSTQRRLQACLELLVNATTRPPNSPKSDSPRHSQRRGISTTSYAMS